MNDKGTLVQSPYLLTDGALSEAFTSLFSGASGSAAAAGGVAASGSAAAAGGVGISAAAVEGGIAGGIVAGAAGGAAGQLVGLATGTIDKFDWAQVGLSAISAGVNGGLSDSGIFGALDIGDGVVDQFAQGALSSAVSQGLGVATGLQSKLDWVGVAAAGVAQAAGSYAGAQLPNLDISPNGPGGLLLTGTARLLANAAVRTLVSGTDFGDNIIAALPDTIGQTIGNVIAGQIDQSDNSAAAQQAPPQPGQYSGTDTPTQIGSAPLGPPVQVSSLPPIPTNGSTLSSDTNGNYYLNNPDGTVQQWNSATNSYGPPIEQVVVTASRINDDSGMEDPQFGSMRIIIIPKGAKLVPVLRRAGQMFTTSAINAANSQHLGLVVNGEFFSRSTPYSISSYFGTADPLSASTTEGLVVQNGQVVAGTSEPDHYYIAETTDSDGNPTYTFGQGDPPTGSNVVAAFGGALPLIVNGLPYGEQNIYGPDGQLLEQASPGLTSDINMGPNVGKTIIAYNDTTGQLAVVVDSGEDGQSYFAARDYLYNNGYTNALIFDGSSSSTLVYNGQLLVSPAPYKNATINVGIGVQLPKNH